MKKLIVGAAALFLLPTALSAQQPADSTILSAARRVISNVQYCALLTVSSDGAPHARVVQQFPPDSDFTIWIGTNPQSRKVAELEHDAHATVFCEDKDGSYVSLIGNGMVVRDVAIKAQHWNPAWTQFYKNGFRGDDFVLIKVVPTMLEMVSYPLGIVSQRADWRAATVQLRK